MGRHTHESIGRPLPGRQNIVVSSLSEYQAPGCDVVHSIEDGLNAAGDAEELMVIGGSSLFKQMFGDADMLYLTRVHAELEGDTWFPDWDESQWQLLSQESHPADEKMTMPTALRFISGFSLVVTSAVKRYVNVQRLHGRDRSDNRHQAG